MKKSIIVIAAVAALTVSSLALAQKDDKSKKMMGNPSEMMKKMGGMKEMGGMMGMCPMMKSMTDRTVIPSSDGGIFIVLGNKLAKYDNKLNLVNEVELKTDFDGMHKMMEKMKGMCPMMKKGMMKDGENAPAEEGDHSSHH